MGGGSFQLMKKIETFREKNVQIEIFSYLFYIFEKLQFKTAIKCHCERGQGKNIKGEKQNLILKVSTNS